jgi:uncharacterized protein
METEVRLAIKKKADEEAIRVFADNLRQLLLAPPLGQKSVLAIDPGLRTGCKVACWIVRGNYFIMTLIYPMLSGESPPGISKYHPAVMQPISHRSDCRGQWNRRT